MNPIDLAWAAGLFEGEGSVRIAGHRRPTPRGVDCQMYTLEVCMTMTDRECVEILHGLFDGWTGTHHFEKGKQRESYKWAVTSYKAGQVLKIWLPYLRSTRVREKAKLAIEFQDQKKRGAARHIRGYTELQASYYQRMKILNRRGVVEAA